MAIHWKQIKGAAEPTSNTSSVVLYSFIVFPKYNPSSSSQYKYPPQFFTSNQRAISPEYGDSTTSNYNSLGFFVLTDYANHFTKDQYFHNSIVFCHPSDVNKNSALWQDNYYLRLGARYFTWNNDFIYTMTGYGTSAQSEIAYSGNLYINKTTNNNGNVTIQSSCKAAFFQATSDERAKTNIMGVSDAECLDLVRKINIYTFKYKNINQDSIGVIAQELMQYNINGFSFVDNIEATGENNDYMSIKESKLIYILLGAVKQLSQEVEDLKAQLK